MDGARGSIRPLKNNYERMKPTSHILMIRPVRFDFNAETAVNNAFQVATLSEDVQLRAALEFDKFVLILREAGVDVMVVNDTPEPHTPDSIFPNNWVSFHYDGTVVLYPMFAANRRLERKASVLDAVAARFEVRKRVDLTHWESRGLYLEGTGSMVLDREERLAYACLSPRTDVEVLEDFCSKLQYRPITFSAVDTGGQPIYHTNVMMCVADTYVVICLDAIPNTAERDFVLRRIRDTGKTIVPITLGQMHHFAGNMLQVSNFLSGERLLVMSSQAYKSLHAVQVETLSSFNRIIHSDLAIIEKNGGGSARCMMAEIFLPLMKG
jgi:hypothetical protein